MMHLFIGMVCCLGRSNDPPPGHQLMWQGYAEFHFMCLGFALWDDQECSDSVMGEGQA